MTTTNDTLAAPGRPRKAGSLLLDTPTCNAIGHVLRLCHDFGEIGIVTGEPGLGKTSAARRYIAKSHDVYHVTMSPATSALVPCLERIGEAIATYPSRTGGAAWTEAIRQFFAHDAEPALLIIDEAQHLSDAALEEVRAISDATPALGVLLMGSRELRDRLVARRWAQLTSRFFARFDLDAPMAADIDAICAEARVEGKRSRSLLGRAASGPGGLRVVWKLIGVAAALAGPDQPIKTEHVEAAFQDRGEMGQ